VELWMSAVKVNLVRSVTRRYSEGHYFDKIRVRVDME